jgi:hypothetical protein
MITNANKYGLLKSSYASEQLELTADALAIVGEKAGERERAKSKISLGIDRIDPFKQLYDKIAGTRLPAKSALVDTIKELGVPDDLADEAVDLFIVNLRYVELLRVLAGADRIVTVDHLLDNLPSAS